MSGRVHVFGPPDEVLAEDETLCPEQGFVTYHVDWVFTSDREIVCRTCGVTTEDRPAARTT